MQKEVLQNRASANGILYGAKSPVISCSCTIVDLKQDNTQERYSIQDERQIQKLSLDFA